MRNLGAVGLLVFLLAGSIIIPGASHNEFSASLAVTDNSSSSADEVVQYDPDTIFSAGTVFDKFSTLIGVDTSPRDFELGDADGDDQKDFVAVISDATDTLSIYNRSSDGTLSRNGWRLSDASMQNLRNIAIGRLDDDTKDDIVVSCSDADENPFIVILFGASNYSTVSPHARRLSLAAANPYEVQIGKFNDTVHNAIAVVCRGTVSENDDAVNVYRYPFSNTTYRKTIIVLNFTNSQMLSHGDANGDGRIDLVVGNLSGPDVCVLLQPSDYTDPWAAYTKSISGKAVDIELIDVMGNGRKDLVFADAENSGVYVFKNTGAGFEGIPQQPIRTQNGLSAIALGEIAGVPATDLVTLSSTYSNASVFLRGDIASWYGVPNLTFPTNYAPVKCEVDRSIAGHEGIFILSAGRTGDSGSLEFFFSDAGPRGNADANVYLPSFDSQRMASGEAAGGNARIATVLSSANHLFVYDYNSTLQNTLLTQSGPADVVFGDFDADGSEDIAVVNSVSGTVSIYGSEDIFLKQKPDLDLSVELPFPTVIESASIRNDGFYDLIVGCDGGAVVLYNAENGSLFLQTLNETLGTSVPGKRTAICVGDFNRDGYGGDIALLNQANSAIELYFRDPAGSVGSYYPDVPSRKLTRGASSFVSMTVEDFGVVAGGYGLADFAILDSSGTVYFFEQPSYGFTINLTSETSSVTLDDAANNIYSDDANDDGLGDFCVSYSGLPMMAVFMRNGDFSFINAVNFTTGGPASDILMEDLDKDGRTDLASSSNASACLSFWVQNNLAPSANATASSYETLEGTTIEFDASGSEDSFSDRDTLSYAWFYGDGSPPDYGVTVSHQYLDHADYDVSLKVTDRAGLSGYSNLTVIVTDGAPTASFSVFPSTPAEGSEVGFTDTSTSFPDTIVNWTWSFGDGNFSFVRNPTHRYIDNGDYLVILTIKDDDDSTDAYSMNIAVSDLAPTAGFSVSDSNPIENTTVLFTDESGSYPDEIVLYDWDFGDGSTITILPGENRNPMHVYKSNGTYFVTLTVEDDDGSVDDYQITIQVKDSAPTALFEFGPSPPNEGDVVEFTDKSTAYDGLVGWSWDFGDGSPLSTIKNPNHQYADNGNYEVNLTVYDSDGSASYFIAVVEVRDTTPSLTSVTTSSGLTTFDEDEFFSIVARVTIAWEPVVKYEWDFSFNGTFVSDRTTGLNSTSYSFGQAGTYTIAVRAWDSDSYSERTITIIVLNIPPSADYTYFVTGAVVTFDASLSSDTPTDNETLEFRWNFGDGTLWSPWSKDPIIEHTFVNKSEEYKVVLNVRDEMYTRAMTRTLDLTPPTVSLISTVQTATVNKPTTIFVNVSDVSGIRAVYLHYRIGSVNYTEIMTPSGSGTYQAQIPSQDRSMTIPYWLEAVDNHGNVFYSGEFEMLVQTVIPMEYWAAGIGILAFGLGGLVMGVRRRYASVDEVFIVYEDGRLIAHETRRLKPGMDDEVLSSMLVAIQSFVKDSFKDENVTTLKRLDFGEKKILIEKGDRVYLAGVLHGRHAGKVPQKMFRVLEDIERDFGPAFTEWDGDFEKVRGVKDRTQPLFKRQWPMPIRIVTLKKLRPKRSDITTVECPMCDSLVPADSKVCPSCGVELAHADVDDLERVARDMMDARPNPDSCGEGADGEGERKGEE